MTYTPAQILAALHNDDEGLARYFLSTLDRDTLAEYALEFAKATPVPILEPLEHAAAIEQAIIRACRYFTTTPANVLSPSRRQAALEARQVVCYVGRLLGMSYVAIGQEMFRDHSTVMNAVVRVGETPRLRRIACSIATELGWDRTVESEAS